MEHLCFPFFHYHYYHYYYHFVWGKWVSFPSPSALKAGSRVAIRCLVKDQLKEPRIASKASLTPRITFHLSWFWCLHLRVCGSICRSILSGSPALRLSGSPYLCFALSFCAFFWPPVSGEFGHYKPRPYFSTLSLDHHHHHHLLLLLLLLLFLFLLLLPPLAIRHVQLFFFAA